MNFLEDGFDSSERDSDSTDLNDEASYICNSCGEEIVVPLDYTEGQSQQYIEDCPVCCNPNVIFVEYEADGQARVWSRSE